MMITVPSSHNTVSHNTVSHLAITQLNQKKATEYNPNAMFHLGFPVE